MKFSRTCLYSLLTIFIVVGCGTQAGNPSKPGGDEIVLPEIKYSLPTTVTGESASLMLAGTVSLNESQEFSITGEDNCTSLMHCKAKRSHRVIKGINLMSERIRDYDKIRVPGKFRNGGPSQNIYGKLEAKKDGAFDYSATMCASGTVFFHMKWSADSSHIVVTRDLSIHPLLDMASRVGKSRIEYTETDGVSTVDIMTQSEWEIPEGTAVDGDTVIEHMVTKIDASQNVEIKSVGDWYDTLPSAFEGDDYMTGTMNKNGIGEFVGYLKSETYCPNGFDENATDLWNPSFGSNPRWCFGRRVQTAAPYTQPQLTAALGRLEPIGVLSKSTLVDVSFDDGVSCD